MNLLFKLTILIHVRLSLYLDNNKNYEIGGSSLNHNPILNPTNNFSYNKYLMNNIQNSNYNPLIEMPIPHNYHNNQQNFNSNLQVHRQQSNLPMYNPINNTLNYDNQNFNNMNFNYSNNLSNNSSSQTPSGGERLRMVANNIIG
jgi:hypothetical protein